MSNNMIINKQNSKKEKKKDIEKAVILYHLQQVGQYIEKIQKSMFILKNFPEDENETREAIALRAADHKLPKISKTYESDRRFIQLMEAFEDENQKIKREMFQLRKILKRYSRLLFLIKNAVIHLREPEKSIIMMRYFKKMSWKEIHIKTGKSESYIFQIHAKGIKYLLDFFPPEEMDFLHQTYLTDSANTFVYSRR